MERIEASTVTKQFKRTFDEVSLNKLGKATRLCRREREATPYRLMLTLVEAFASGSVDSIADIHRAFNALCDKQVQYKPFHNQLSKPGFPTFVRAMLSRLLNELACDVLRFSPHCPFARFEHIRIQDGTSFALKPALADTFSGRFTTISPAAVELHADLDLMSEMLNTVTLSADSEGERQFLPQPEEVAGGLQLADRGYLSIDYMRALDTAGGYFIIRGKANMNPLILKAMGPDGRELTQFRDQPLKAVKTRLSKYDCVDMTVRFGTGAKTFECRMVVHPNLRQDDTPRYLVTNLEHEAFTPEQISDGYRLRWQVELLFKEWKSHSNLHAFDTAKPQHRRGAHLGVAMRGHGQALLCSHDPAHRPYCDIHPHRRQVHSPRAVRCPLQPDPPTAMPPSKCRANHRILVGKRSPGASKARLQNRTGKTWTPPCLCRRLRTNLCVDLTRCGLRGSGL
jgi:hypothetical protein